MDLRYSFVVDTPPLMGYQAFLLTRSLLQLGIQPSHITGHIVVGTSDITRRHFQQLGIRTRSINPFGHPYCNKLQQLATFTSSSSDAVVFLDADTIMCATLDDAPTDAICGKMVDIPTPPMRVLRMISDAAGVAVDSEQSDVVVGSTMAANFNGGVWIVPTRLLPRLMPAWIYWARWCIRRSQLFDRWLRNVDQVSLALAIADRRLPWRKLDRRYNLPTHLGPIDALDRPIILHYHRRLDSNLLLLRTGSSSADVAIEQINTAIVEWQRDDVPKEMYVAALAAYRRSRRVQ